MNTAVQQPLFSIDQMCIDAEKRLQEFINRSTGQHLRAMKSGARNLRKAKA